MRLSSPALALCACALFLPASQEDKGQDIGTPVARFLAEERKRIEHDINGNWLLLRLEKPDVLIDQSDVRGFAVFCDGFLTLTLQGRAPRPGFFGPRPFYFIYGGSHRYRISESVHVQTACVMGFSNDNPAEELFFEPSNNSREYEVQLKGDDLTLRRSDGTTYVFTRAVSGKFPEEALESLEKR